MTALVEVASYLPPDRVPIEDLADGLGLTPMQVKVFRRYHKLGEVRRDHDGTLLDLLRRAVAGLSTLRGHEHRVRYVLFARTFPVVVPFPLNPLHTLCREVGLGHAQAFTVTHQACASGLLAIDVAGRLLAAEEPGALALILAGEKAFTGETQLVPETSVFGEGASAALVSAHGERDRMVSYAAHLHGEFDGDSPELMNRFQQEYTDLLAGAVRAAVDDAGLKLDEIDVVLPHNVNVIAWQRVCRTLGVPLERVLLDHVSSAGHVFCADAFINYRTARERGLLRPGGHYVVAAAGAARGATFSAMVFQH